jgi:hypothetical protein
LAKSAPTNWDRTTWYSTRNCGIKDCHTYDFVAGRVDQANSKDYSAGFQSSIIDARSILKIANMANLSRQMPKHALRAILRYQTIFDALEDPAVLKDLQIFGLCKEQLVRILLRTHHASSRILHGHLL